MMLPPLVTLTYLLAYNSNRECISCETMLRVEGEGGGEGKYHYMMLPPLVTLTYLLAYNSSRECISCEELC